MIVFLLLALIGCGPGDLVPVRLVVSVENDSSSDLDYVLCYDPEIDPYDCVAAGTVEAGGSLFDVVDLPGVYLSGARLTLDAVAISPAGDLYMWGPRRYHARPAISVNVRYTDADRL